LRSNSAIKPCRENITRRDNCVGISLILPTVHMLAFGANLGQPRLLPPLRFAGASLSRAACAKNCYGAGRFISPKPASCRSRSVRPTLKVAHYRQSLAALARTARAGRNFS
jgi:hypothetical protein